MITTSEIKISVLVAREFALEALRTVHEAFELDVDRRRRGARRRPDGGRLRRARQLAAKLVARLQRMEKLIIEDISLDESQARVTFVGLPDIPGLAAQVFDEIAEAGIVVDMIVQSVGRRNAREHLLHGPRRPTWRSRHGGRPSRPSCSAARRRPIAARVAKLSVFGVGMKSHTGVATRMFQSLAAEGINVDHDQHQRGPRQRGGRRPAGQKALATLREEFADAMV